MAISLRCTGCRVLMKLRDELAGKKVRCPRCKTVLRVPAAEQEDLVEAVVEKKRVEEPPPRKPTGRTGRVQREEPVGLRKQKVQTELPDEPRPVAPPKKAGPASKYKPCPRCATEGPKRVTWTSWGSFYGPRLFNHVQCPECGYCYNGKTGRSNALPATIFVLMPLLGILAILGGIGYVVVQRGWLSF